MHCIKTFLLGGNTKMIANMLKGIEIRLNIDYLANKIELDQLAEKVVYTGSIDVYFHYQLGTLEYRSAHFENEVMNIQGNGTVNYTDREISWTCIIEYKWFEFGNDEKNILLYVEYKKLAQNFCKLYLYICPVDSVV